MLTEGVVFDMTDSMTAQLEQDLQCERLLECLHGLNALETECYQVLIEGDAPMTIDDIAEHVDRERSTTYRAIQRLLQDGFVDKAHIACDQGGYYHVYSPTDSSQIATEMRRTLNEWYATMGQRIHEFEGKYQRSDDRPLSLEKPLDR